MDGKPDYVAMAAMSCADAQENAQWVADARYEELGGMDGGVLDDAAWLAASVAANAASDARIALGYAFPDLSERVAAEARRNAAMVGGAA